MEHSLETNTSLNKLINICQKENDINLLFEGCQIAQSFIEYHVRNFDKEHKMNLEMDMDTRYRSNEFIEKYGLFNLYEERNTKDDAFVFSNLLCDLFFSVDRYDKKACISHALKYAGHIGEIEKRMMIYFIRNWKVNERLAITLIPIFFTKNTKKLFQLEGVDSIFLDDMIATSRQENLKDWAREIQKSI